MDIGVTGHVDVMDFEGIENLGGGRPAGGIGHVVIADKQEHGNARGGQTLDTPGELALLGLRGFTALVGITAEQYQIGFIINSVVHELVEGGQEIVKARGQSCGLVDASVVLYSQVQIGEMDDSHCSISFGGKKVSGSLNFIIIVQYQVINSVRH